MYPNEKGETDMSKTKLALDVVQDLRRLADSIEALCDGMEGMPSW